MYPTTFLSSLLSTQNLFSYSLFLDCLSSLSESSSSRYPSAAAVTEEHSDLTEEHYDLTIEVDDWTTSAYLIPSIY